VARNTYTLTVFVEPHHSITLSDRDVERLVTKLRQLESALGTFPERIDFTDAAARIDAGETDARGVQFKPGEDVGILRALDELRVERPLGTALVRLRDLLVATIGPGAVTYQLELQQADGQLDRSKVFFSYSGAYTVGERLPILPEGTCWEVVEVRETEPGFNDELVCRPCPNITLDVNVVRDFQESDRDGHENAVALFDLRRRGDVEFSTAPQGYRLDVERGSPLAESLRETFANEGVGQARQLAYPSEVTYPGEDLFPGRYVEGLPEAWNHVAANWHSHEWTPPEDADRLYVETHIIDRGDVFLTDDRPLRVMCRRLREEHHYPVVAMTVAEYLRRRETET